MPLEVVPTEIALYPGDTQTFTLRGAPPPSGWIDPAGGTIQSNGTVVITSHTAGDQVSATLMHTLRSGFGRIQTTLDQHCVPRASGSSGVFYWEIKDTNLTCIFGISIKYNGLEMANASMTPSSDTDSTVAAIGNVAAVVIQGNRWSFELNGTEIFYAIPNAATAYPIMATFGMTNRPLTDYAQLPVFELTGNWQVSRATEWSLVQGNSATALTGDSPTVEIIAPGYPTEYTLNGLVETLDQLASAQITIPALTILGARPRIVTPVMVSGSIVSSDIQFRANYDDARDEILIGAGGWTAVTTGSFSSTIPGLYTPSTVPSTTSKVRATVAFGGNTQKDEVGITIDTVLLPSSQPIYPAEARTSKTNMTGTLSWAANGATLAGTGQVRTWTAPSVIGQAVRIQVENATPVFRYQEYEVLDVLPVGYTIVPTQFEVGPDMLLDYPAGGRDPWGYRLTEEGFGPKTWEVQSNGLTVAELATLTTFHDTYFSKQGRFFFIDYVNSSAREAVRFDSKLKGEAAGDCMFNMSYRLRRA